MISATESSGIVSHAPITVSPAARRALNRLTRLPSPRPCSVSSDISTAPVLPPYGRRPAYAMRAGTANLGAAYHFARGRSRRAARRLSPAAPAAWYGDNPAATTPL